MFFIAHVKMIYLSVVCVGIIEKMKAVESVKQTYETTCSFNYPHLMFASRQILWIYLGFLQ